LSLVKALQDKFSDEEEAKNGFKYIKQTFAELRSDAPNDFVARQNLYYHLSTKYEVNLVWMFASTIIEEV
jgi:hypothetical protein